MPCPLQLLKTPSAPAAQTCPVDYPTMQTMTHEQLHQECTGSAYALRDAKQ